MMRRLIWMLVVGSVCSCGKTEGVGDPCVPEDEANADFAGFSINEVSVESRSFQCESRICLVNHFQGRVGCPLGQVEGGGGCKTASGDPVTVPIKPWNANRPARSTVYCSCRCDGPDPDARYCECPSGFSCEPLVDDLGLGSSELAGSYCIADGTRFEPSDEVGDICTTASHPACQ